MNWSDERYVRLYVRDTAEWLCWPWEARACFPLLLRKADRAGVIETRLGAKGIATLIAMPADVVDVALHALQEDGCIQPSAAGFVIRNFLPAQEVGRSDVVRQRELREKRREEAAASRPVTDGHDVSRDVTDGHGASQNVTPFRSVPDHSIPSHSGPKGRRARNARAPQQSNGVIGSREVMTAWCDWFKRVHDKRATWTKREYARADALLLQHPLEEVMDRMRIAFESPRKFPPQPWSFTMFVNHFDEVAVAMHTNESPARQMLRRTDELEAQDDGEPPPWPV